MALFLVVRWWRLSVAKAHGENGSTGVPPAESGIAPDSAANQSAINQAEWRNPDNYSFGLYFSKRDSRVVVPRRIGLGWTLNIGRWLGAASLFGIIILVSLIGVFTNLRFHRLQEAVQKPDAEAPVPATAAYTGDCAAWITNLGTVDSSNSAVFSIPQDYVQEVVKRLDAGQLLPVEAEDRQGKTFGHGFLQGVDNQMDTATGTLRCKAALVPDGDHLMMRGMYVTIRLLLEMKHGVTLVLAEAIQHDAQGAFVWAIKPDQTVSHQPVQTGTIDGAKVEIQSGLLPGELVVTGPANNNLHEGRKIRCKLVENGAATPAAPAAAHNLSFGPVIERTLKIDGNECDFLVLRSGKVLHHSRVDPGEMSNDTQLSPFMQWVRKNGVDMGFCASTHTLYSSLAVTMFDMGILPFGYDTVPNARIPGFRSTAELRAYRASHDGRSSSSLVGHLVGVTNIWNDLTAEQLHESPEEEPAFFLKDKHFAMWLRPASLLHPIAFSTREGVAGLLQITSFTTNPPIVKLRYKLAQEGK